MSVEEQVVLVNSKDEVVGTEEKLKAHELGLLHRAFSVFVYRYVDDKIEFLLQQRHQDKYHCGGLWTNTCCSHPRLTEDIISAGRRRLKEEMSLDVPLTRVGQFEYRTSFSNGLIEHELDHVMIGEYNPTQTIVLAPAEAQAYAWRSVEEIQHDLLLNPTKYTPWFQTAFDFALRELCFSF